MIKQAIIPNPFEPYFKRLEDVEYCPLKTLKGYYHGDGTDELIYVVNGQVIDQPETYVPADNTIIVITVSVKGGGIGKILGFVALVAVMVYAGAVAGGAWASWAGAAFKAGHIGAVLAGAAVSIVGGMVVNSIFPQTVNNALTDTENSSPTYGWDIPAPAHAEGNIVGRTYGECIPQAQVLTQHVETVNGKQYLCLLLCGGQGPIDSISNIRIGNNNIGNYSDVQIETRLGTNDQEPISFFNNNPIDQYISLELDTTALIQTTTSKTATSLEVTMEWPGGLYILNDKGERENTTVVIKLEYRVKGASDWTTWNANWSITGKDSSQLNQSTRIDGLAANQYEVRATLVNRDTSAKASTITRWELLTTYDAGKYSRPGKVLVGLRILATNQLSGGVPSINWRQRRNNVWVYDPTAAAYVQKPADNPIWATYDILHQCDYLKNVNTGNYEYVVSGCRKERLSKYWQQWVTAAAYSDGMVLNEHSEYEKRFMFDAFFDTSQKRIVAANKAAAVGHATVLKHGNDLGIVVDMPGSIQQIFGEGRTTAESVSGFFTGSDERARVLEITYNDKNDDYKNTRFLCRSQNWIADDRENDPTTLTLFGVARRSQAWREGIKAILTNQLQLQYVEFKADVDAMRCEYGDIIGWNHKVNAIGIESGRILSATSTSVQLDKTIDFTAGKSYQLWIQKNNDTLVNKTFFGSDITTDTINVSFADSELPSKYDNYALGYVNQAVKPFRIVNIGISQDQLCSIKCCEYNEAVYADSDLDYSKFPVKSYTTITQLQAPISLALSELNYVKNDMSQVHRITATWKLPRGAKADHFNVQISEDGSTWRSAGSTEAFRFDIDNLNPPRAYYVRVCSVLDGMYSGYVSLGIQMSGIDTAPPDVTKLYHELLANGHRRFWWDFTYPEPNDIKGFRLKYTPNGSMSWDRALPLSNGVITSAPFETDMLRQGMATVMIKAVDNMGQESKNVAMLSVNFGDLLQENVLWTKDLSADNWSAVETDGYIDKTDGALKGLDSTTMWSDPNAPMWATPDTPMWRANFKSFYAKYTFTAPASGQFWLEIALTGPLQVTYAINGNIYPYTQKVMVKAGDSITVTMTSFAGAYQVSVSKLVLYIDVPDVVEHFYDLVVPASGLTLPIKTPHYYTTAVRIDSVENNAWVQPQIISRNPCIIKLYNSSGTYVAGTVDITWQGFEKEMNS